MAPPSTQKPLLQDEKEHSVTQGDVDDETWARMPVRERFGWYYERCSRENFTLPVFTLFVFYVVVGLVWYAGWYYIGMDHSKAVFDPWNARRFICYNILHGITGLGSTCGPLGGKVKVPFFACFLTFLTPGSLASPLFPGFVRLFQKIPARRGVLGIIAFAAFYASMVQAMLDPTPLKVTYAVAALGMASTFDTVIFFTARGEHYGYQMIYLMWPDWIAGVQWSQLAMYFFVGVSKVGPWFKYVVLVLVKDALFTPFLPKHTLAKLFYKDWPRDYSPSCVPKFLQILGYLLEWGFPACMVMGLPGSNLNNVGVWGMVVYHFFIWITLPMASVFEWQYYCVYINMFFFGHNELAMPTSPSLIAFLLFTGVFLPIVGQIWPLTVPFLLAYRQYAGNWRIGTWFVRHDAAHKLEKIKSYHKVLWYTEAPKELGGLRADFTTMAAFFEVAHFRGLISMQEKFLEERGAKADDYYSVSTFNVANSLFGWDLAVGWTLSRDCVVEAVAAMCDFQPGELYCMYILPAGILPPHTTGYHLFDVTKGPRDAEMFVQMPYKELEGTHPVEVQIDFSKMKAGNSVNGTILDAWY